MISRLKKVFKWGSAKDTTKTDDQSSLMALIFLGGLEDVLFWESTWLSLVCIFLVNLVLGVCAYQQINFLGFTFSVFATIVIMDAFETWLKYKHRSNCLKRLAYNNGDKLYKIIQFLKHWAHTKFSNYLFLRETIPTKAFLIISIVLSGIFIIGTYVSGYMITYLLCMFICFSKHIVPPVIRTAKKIQQHADSDAELEGLIPEDVDIKLLSIEPENQVFDEKQSLDYWKPVDVPIEEVSDSSDSSSIVTNLSAEKMHSLEKDVETSDSSEDEYIPHAENKELLKSTVEVVSTDNSWSGAAYNTFWNITGAVTGYINSSYPESKRKRVSSADSSDSFEFIEKNDLNVNN